MTQPRMIDVADGLYRLFHLVCFLEEVALSQVEKRPGTVPMGTHAWTGLHWILADIEELLAKLKIDADKLCQKQS